MTSYIIRRTLYMIPTLILITLICFTILYIPPGDFLTSYKRALVNQEGMNRTQALKLVERLREKYNLDAPFFVQYYGWIKNIVLHGNFGQSFDYREPVTKVIMGRLGMTFAIAFTTLVFTWLVAIPVGIYSATHQYGIGDYTFTLLAFVGISIPNFFFALVMMFVMVFFFNSSAVGGLFSPEFLGQPWSWPKFVDMLKHVWIVIIVIGTAGMAGTMRVMRGNLLDVLQQQYVQTARSKGLREWNVVYKHAVRNAIQPLIMRLGMLLPRLIQGAVVTGIVLNLPTAGPLFYRAISNQDMYLAATFLLMMAVLLLVGNLVADILLALIDPRIRYE